jgi:hypothetical protein
VSEIIPLSIINHIKGKIFSRSAQLFSSNPENHYQKINLIILIYHQTLKNLIKVMNSLSKLKLL